MGKLCSSPRSPLTVVLRAQTDMDLPIASLDAFGASPGAQEAQEEARKVAKSLIDTGAVIIRDSRASQDANSRFLDLFEDYFAQPEKVLRDDERPEVGYQVVRPFKTGSNIRA